MTSEEFDAQYCANLSRQQLDAVHAVNGAVLLLAVPGSGKTTVLVSRLGYMVLVCGIMPASILTVTYTVAAMKEMKRRFSNRFGRMHGDSMRFSTINSLAVGILRRYSETHARGGAFALISASEQRTLISDIYREINKERATDSAIGDVKSSITYIKNMMLDDSEIKNAGLPAENMDKIYPAYREKMKSLRLMDYDDQLVYALAVLRSYPDILAEFQEQFQYICVDESQDTSKIQHEIIKLLASKSGNIFMVGDEDQSIYGFRAAYPQALLDFERDHHNARVLLMEDNYRSSKEITQAAAAFVAKNRFRYDKSLRPARDGKAPLNIITVPDRLAQFRYVLELARSCRGGTAVIYRNNDSALPLIDMFERCNIPYNCRAIELGFFTNRLVSDIRDIVELSHDPYNDELFMRVYYKFSIPITRVAAQAACAAARSGGKTIVEELADSRELSGYGKDGAAALALLLPQVCRGSAVRALQVIWTGMKYGVYARENRLDEGKFQILLQLARQESTAMGLLRRLDELKNIVSSDKKSPDGIILSTVHLSKGLEYEKVYLLDVIDGILPAKPRTELENEDDLRLYEEDRRIFYVGMTRAKDELSLFAVKDRASEFITEVRSSLPRVKSEPDELFFPFDGNLIGKVYRSALNGEGTVTAQAVNGELLVEYKSGKTELASIGELYASRDKSVRCAPEKVSTGDLSGDAGMAPGTAVIHRSYGRGVVTAFSDGIASIDFGGITGVRRIMAGQTLHSGIMRIEEDIPF